jgi:uncharacterized heparinase superfamily protein
MMHELIPRLLRRTLPLLLVLACSSADDGTAAPLGNWGSTSASLTTEDTTARLLLATGECYGASADIAQRIPLGAFALTGTFTQLTGVAPGSVQYPAQFSGNASSTAISILVTLPSQGQQLGPFTLAFGVVKHWDACAFP